MYRYLFLTDGLLFLSTLDVQTFIMDQIGDACINLQKE